jgi:hypothetical protein
MARTIEEAIRAAGVSDEDASSYRQFVGYLGKTSPDDLTRLYLNEQLNEYIEVATNVTKTIQLGNEGSPLVMLLIEDGANVEHVVRLSDRMYVSDQVAADFLAGEIAERYLDQIGTISSPPPRPIPFSVGGRCRPKTA